jgi:GDP-L-fucose synthase
MRNQHERTVLVTGGTGLVGRALKAHVEASKINGIFIFASSSEADLREYGEAFKLFDKYKPTHVVHLAVRLMAGSDMGNHMADLLVANLAIDSNVLRCAHEFKVSKLVSTLSSFAYPQHAHIPIAEGQLHDGKLHPLYEAYGLSKRVLETLSRAYRKQFNDNFVTVVPTNIFGRVNTYRDDGPVMDALICKALHSARTGQPFVCRGTGAPLRQFCYAPDLANALLWVLDNYNDPEPLNITGQEISIREVAFAVANQFGVADKVQFDSTYPDGPLCRTLSDAKLRCIFPEYSPTSFGEALDSICAEHLGNISTP